MKKRVAAQGKLLDTTTVSMQCKHVSEACVDFSSTMQAILAAHCKQFGRQLKLFVIHFTGTGHTSRGGVLGEKPKRGALFVSLCERYVFIPAGSSWIAYSCTAGTLNSFSKICLISFAAHILFWTFI